MLYKTAYYELGSCNYFQCINLIYVQAAYQYTPTCDNNYNSVAYYCTFKKIIINYLF